MTGFDMVACIALIVAVSAFGVAMRTLLIANRSQALEVGTCRECGCTDAEACWPYGCYWVEPDLCSACTPAALAAGPDRKSTSSPSDVSPAAASSPTDAAAPLAPTTGGH